MSVPSIVELRQYTVHPERRDDLIDLFDHEFIAPQEAAGMTLIGQFRDLDKPDRFVWMRGFASMTAREEALRSFYGGPVWKAHRDAANATMIDSDNVLLLHPAGSNGSFPPSAKGAAPGLVVASIYSIEPSHERDVVEIFDRFIRPALEETGASVLASFVTDPSENTFPALPVREGEHVFVALARFENDAAYARHLDERAASPSCHEASQRLAGFLLRPIETLRLSPTANSRLR